MSRQFSLFLLSLALLSLSAPAWATHIYVSGDQTGTWSADTVIVTGEVRVPPGASLTILPGVEVLFSVYCKLIVDTNATLQAVGTVADSIRFDVLPPDTAWHGIRFLSASSSSRLEYCLITHGYATGAGEDCKGGAIYCSNSSPTISHNTISGNIAIWGGGIGYGGGIYCTGSTCTIANNIIANNNSTGDGGGICCQNNSGITITGNIIIGNNFTGGDGGGIYSLNSNAIISANVIYTNYATHEGGGIYCSGNNSRIVDNFIIANSISSSETLNRGGGINCYSNGGFIAGNIIALNTVISSNQYANPEGGGIFLGGPNSIVTNNTILNNSATAGYENGSGGGIYTTAPGLILQGNIICGNHSGNGGGIYNTGVGPIIRGCTFASNIVTYWYGIGAIYSQGSGVQVDNCIFWGNSMDPVGPLNNFSVTYSCTYITGTGNFFSDPLFVNFSQSEYRLQWGSPCIDSGDPNPLYNDPDSTRSDMGAWYYDQSRPVRLLLTPYNAPIQIPASGGSFQCAIQTTNIGSTTLPALVWCNITLPRGTIYGPVLGPVTISLGAGLTVSRLRTQTVPGGAPAGMYHYNAFAVAAGDTSSDSFAFTKAGAGGAEGLSGWANTGEDFGEAEKPLITHNSAIITSLNPNPFNATTAIGFKLQAASLASLKVYNTAGRLVATLVDGPMTAGTHEATFDGSNLASGIYLAKLTAGSYTTTQKLVLLK